MLFGDQIDKILEAEKNDIKAFFLGMKALVDYTFEQANGFEVRLFGIPILTINTQPIQKAKPND